ncbi:MAG: hypothetical protein ACE15C_15815 [Phycisphaerae bacterium]
MVTRRTAVLMVVILAMAAAPALAADMIDNPAYKNWAQFKVGASAKTVQEMAMAGQTTRTEMTSTLKELTPEKAVIEMKTVAEVAGQKIENTQKIEHAAKIEKAAEPTTKPQMKEGTEEIEVAGKKIKCKWVETTAEQAGTKTTSKVWTSDEIPGLMAKMETKTEGPVSMTTTTKLVEFSTGK